MRLYKVFPSAHSPKRTELDPISITATILLQNPAVLNGKPSKPLLAIVKFKIHFALFYQSFIFVYLIFQTTLFIVAYTDFHKLNNQNDNEENYEQDARYRCADGNPFGLRRPFFGIDSSFF